MDENRWLTPPEQRAWRAYVESATLLFDALDRDMQQDAGIPHAYYVILVRLSEAPDQSMRMSELADVTRSSRSRLSHAVARLQERGWVDRVDCETDRRGQVAQLTPQGLSALGEAAPKHVEAVRAYVIDRLSPAQLAALEEIGDTVIAGFTDPEASVAS
ncbi:DNA-binding MarR family transcriptional regulator [Jatrophihabitans sp. GAS493]|uniref:MarR family winged helix-turn-helix transcriptional regulator n=1 Tax=Jatrophihabitans sp. GAS493 TaxID=1907575 RepID=UPI000BB7DE14|nr:MarR family transcriptional regulator [Jatrophihabitans sp. GAS493]SOD71355.1 DNA-binding MarR family transcriptional regulator [Jatrophihabitans sp. GAS493]